MNGLSDLLKLNYADIVKAQTKELEIERLSSLIKSKFTITIKSIDKNYMEDLMEEASTLTTLKERKEHMCSVLSAGIVEPSKDDKQLKAWLGLSDRAPVNEIWKKLFTLTEIINIYTEIINISGVNGNVKVFNEIEEKTKKA